MKTTVQRINQKVCFICGAGHSGSTLLGLILGSHTDCFYSGEASKTRFLQDQNKQIKKRVCKICGPDCVVWGELSLSDRIDLYEQLSAKTQKTIIIDSAKNIDWLTEQLDALSNTSSQAFLIFLQRDGRAVINSRVRKYSEKDVKELIQGWMTQIQMTDALFNSFPHKKIKIHYEDLATEPASVVQTICEFLEISYQPEMLNYYQHEHHPLGGNNGTQFLVAKAQSEKIKNPFVSLSDRTRDYYQDHNLGITLDLRWKQELDPSVERLFEEMAGQVNQELKWEG